MTLTLIEAVRQPSSMGSDYDVSVSLDPLEDLAEEDLRDLQKEMQQLGTLCLTRLPNYQVFIPNIRDAFDNKHIVLVRQNGTLVAFVSALALQIPEIERPVVHTGLVVIHPHHRRSNALLQHLYGNLFVALLMRHPDGLWLTSLAEVVSSLVNISIYAKSVYPSPGTTPSRSHSVVARGIDRHYRGTMLISPDAVFDDMKFVFRGSNDHDAGRMFMKDVDDKQFWHRDEEASQYYRRLFRKDKGDEVLQVGFLDAAHLQKAANASRHAQRFGGLLSKL